MTRICFECGGIVPDGQAYDYCEEHRETGEQLLAEMGNTKEIITIAGIKILYKLMKNKEPLPKNSVQLVMDYMQRKEKELSALKNHLKSAEKQLAFAQKILLRVGKYGK